MGLVPKSPIPERQLSRGVLLLGCLISWVFASTDEEGLLHFRGNNTIRSTLEVSSTPSCWIYTHLQKSGGSTIKNIIMSHGVLFPETCDDCDLHYTIYDSEQWKRGNEWRDEFVEQLVAPGAFNFAMGGYTEALRTSPKIGTNCLWFIQFRHPITRLVSAFFYCKTRPGDILCATRSMPEEAHSDLIAFAKHWGNFGVRQLALGILPLDGQSVAGSASGRSSGWYLQRKYMDEMAGYSGGDTVADSTLSHILKRVQDRLLTYSAVGILEEFNSTLSLFDAVLGVPGVRWHEAYSMVGIRNAGKRQYEEMQDALAHAWTNSELKSYIRLDLLLYEHAVDVFRQQTEFHGIS